MVYCCCAQPLCKSGKQLLCELGKQLFYGLGKQLLFGVGEINCKAHLLSQYNAVVDSTAPQGQGNCFQDPPALIVQRYCRLNCSVGSRKLILRPSCTTLSHTQLLCGLGKQLLCRVEEIGCKAHLLLRYNAVADSTTLQGQENRS